MRICVPVPPRAEAAAEASPLRRLGSPVGVIDNSKPRFDVLARAILEELARAAGVEHAEELYVRKPSPTRPAEADEIALLAREAQAVLIGSGD